jgi:hypothetical protein
LGVEDEWIDGTMDTMDEDEIFFKKLIFYVFFINYRKVYTNRAVEI